MDKSNIIKKYTNGEVTIVWKPGICIHSAICWKQPHGLPKVFSPQEKPWIKPDAAETNVIIKQVKKCPSGALSYYLNDAEEPILEITNSDTKLEIIPNGPIMINGTYTMLDSEGNEKAKNKNVLLCRCGGSAKKPFCDGTHSKIGFNDQM
jgi:uncharacterized Fe-S cluster protein YjdI